MKKSDFAGWKDVFRFSLVQTIKNKSFIVSFLIMLTLSIVSMPLLNVILFKSDDKIDESESPIETVYVINETPYALDFTSISAEHLKNIQFTTHTDLKKAETTIEEQENNNIILQIKEDDMTLQINYIRPSETPIKKTHLTALNEEVMNVVKLGKYKTLNITAEQINLIDSTVATSLSMINADGSPVIEEDTSISNSEYWIVYGVLFVLMMINIMASTLVATSIVTEKSTRIVEYLLISVRPLALMIGKILSMILVVILQIGSIVLAVFASNKVSSLVTGQQGALSHMLPSGIFDNLTIVNLILCILLMGLGLLFYGGLAAMAGATVSKQEELNEGLTLFTMTNLIGVYTGIAAANVLMSAGSNAFTLFAFLFPLSSPFLLPGAIIIGKTSPILIAAAVLLLILFVILLYLFVARVYETLILHNGNKIKVKELIKISKR